MEFNEQEKALISEITGQAQKFITDKLNGMINNQEFAQKMEALNESIKTETKAVQESLTATLKEQGIAIEELQAMKQRDYKEPTFADQVSKQLNQHIELLKNWKPGQSIEMAITNKAVANMSSANYSGGYVGISAWDPAVGQFARRSPFLRELIRTRPIADQYISWFDKATNEGGAGMQTEGSAKSQADFNLVERKLPVETVASYVTVTKQALADLPYLQSIINDELRELVELELDSQILTGDGASPNLKGIETYATAYATTGFTDLIENANIFDFLVTAKSQVAKSNHNATVALMNPNDVALLRMVKDSNGRYATDMPGGLMTSAGVLVVENNGVTANEAYILDPSKCTLGIREEFNISVGLNSDNFTKNQVTILGEMRAVHYVKENDKTAIVYSSNITNAIAALETP